MASSTTLDGRRRQHPLRTTLATLCLLAALAGASAGGSGGAAAPRGLGVVFSVFEALPPSGACPGLYAVDARTREISWLGGWDAQRDDAAVYPRFTAGGALSFAYLVDPSRSRLVDVYEGRRSVARTPIYTSWAWSPRRQELAYHRLRDRGRRLELVLRSLNGTEGVLAPASGAGLSWLPDGSGLVFERRTGSTDVITFVRRDARGRRDLARKAVSPLVSPDGRRVAFLRLGSARSGRLTAELWVVGSRGGAARKVLGPTRMERLAPAIWLSNRELLVQRGGSYDSIFNAGDTLNRIDVDTGDERPFLRHAFAIALAPDANGVLFVRPHRGDDTYYSIRTVRMDGRDEKLLAVTDEEDLNVRSFPVWKPAAARVGWVGDPPPAGLSADDCVRRIRSLRDRTS